MSMRNWAYDLGLLKSTSFEVPIICVGNLRVGGSGKTPMVIYLCQQFKDKQVAVLSRGYGRESKGYKQVELGSSSKEFGDEPLLIKEKCPECLVVVCEDRVAGVEQIIASHPKIDLIILDDGFQHRAIKAKINLVLSSYHKPFFNDLVFPAGRLREFASGIKRADAVIISKVPEQADLERFKKKINKPLFYSKLTYDDLEAERVFAVSALADDSLYLEHLRHNYELIDFRSFTDHYDYSLDDLIRLEESANGASLVCTSKDAVKWRELMPNLEFEVLETQWVMNPEFLSWLREKIKE